MGNENNHSNDISANLPDVDKQFKGKSEQGMIIDADSDAVRLNQIPQILTEGRRRGRLEVSDEFESKLEELVPDIAGLKVKVNADDYMMKAYTIEMFAHKDERQYINLGDQKEVVDDLLNIQFTFNEFKDNNQDVSYMMTGHTRSTDMEMVEHMDTRIIGGGQKPIEAMNDFLVDFIAQGKFQPYLDHHNGKNAPTLGHDSVDADFIEVNSPSS